MSKKRYLEFDWQNVLFCLIVVFIHSYGTIAIKLDPESLWHIFSQCILKNCAFVVQGFIFLSGAKYTAAYMNREFSFGKFLISRIKKVVIPYILCTCVYYAVYLRVKIVDVADFTELVGYIFRGDLSAHFYFILAIVQFYLLMPLWIFISRKLPSWAILTGGFLIYAVWAGFAFGRAVFYDRIFLSYLPFWAFGTVFGKDYEKYKEFIIRHLWKLGILYALLFCLNGFLGQMVLLNGLVREAIHTVYAIGAIIITFGIFLRAKGLNSVLISGLNKLSFEIYLWHCLALTIIDLCIRKMLLPRISQEIVARVGGIYFVIFAAGLIAGLLLKIKKQKREKVKLI